MMPMLNIALGEVVFGGVGVGIMGLLVIRHPGGVHRRADGGPHARVPGQEDRGPRDEAGDRSRCSISASRLSASRPSPACCPQGTRRPLNAGPHGLSEILYGTHLADRQQRQRLRRSDGQRHLLGHDRRPVHVVGPLLLHHPVPRAGQLAGRQEVGAALERHLPDHRASSSSCSLVGVILIVGALTYFPAFALGPIVEHFLMYAGKLF